MLLQALSDRMMETDFLDYTSNSSVTRQWNTHPAINSFSSETQHHQSNNQQRPHLNFVLEKRDGTLLHNTLDLNSSVTDVLKSLADALHASGTAKLSAPPPTPSSGTSNDFNNRNDVHWTNSMDHDIQSKNGPIDHRYDVNTNKGRDLYAFLSSIDPSYIEERRAFRMDVSAAALVARRMFTFQSIDGISLGWSSESFLVILNAIIRLYEEHQSRFHVDSFYPLRLKFSLDEFRFQALDVYDGTIYLNPAATQLEWLESLQEVTEEKLDEFSDNRRITEERVAFLHEQMGVRVRKGYSCSSIEYHHFLEQMVGSATSTFSTMITQPAMIQRSENATALMAASNGLIPLESAVSSEMKFAQLVVESPTALRRAKVTDDGSIRIPSNESRNELEDTLARLSQSAQDRWQVEQEYIARCKQAIQQLQWELGVQKVFRTGVVPRNEFLNAISRLLEQTSSLNGQISGHALGIAGAGQFCSISDDGSLIVPFNWT